MASLSRLTGSLQRFRLNGVRDTGITVGDGAYATVVQYDFLGLKCVGKKIHRLLYEHASPAQRTDMLRRFEEECELLGRLHHPNIVQFLGVHVETGSELPVLVMEYLPTNLSGYLDRHGILPFEASHGILRDVALGLRYLHEYPTPIVHRDLSANNVLLTASLSAKISDLGVAKILNITPSQMTQKMSTKAPGTPCYMPPEALLAQPSYSRKIDSFSFGVMILHVLCGEWPFPTDPFQRDLRNPGIYVPVMEVDRRAKFLQQIGSEHPLSGLVHQCLSNAPNERPESADILQQIDTALSRAPTDRETMFQQLEGLRSEVQRLGTENQRLGSENLRLQNEIQGIRGQSYHDQVEPSSSGAAVDQPLICRVKMLSVNDPARSSATNNPESQLHSGVRLQWRKRADAPVEVTGSQIVVMGEKLYVGVGHTTDRDAAYQVFQYNWRGGTWSTLPHCPVRWFGMAHFMGRLITVGGRDLEDSLTGKVHALREEFQQWEEFLMPMYTARCFLSVATTSEAIIAAGGDIKSLDSTSSVEVYSNVTSQWHTADSLPVPCVWMSSVIIDHVFYLLGGIDQTNSANKSCWCTSLPSLIQKAVSSTPRSVGHSVWNHLPPTLLRRSAAACLSGSLVAIGGKTDDNTRSSAVYVLLNNSWVRLRNGDILSPRSVCATAQLSPIEVIVIGGFVELAQQSNTVFIGKLHS